MLAGRRWFGSFALVLLALSLGCGGEDPVGPDPAVAPFVGEWEAAALTLTSVANPLEVRDLLDEGATFALNVQPSGQYTAILVIASQSLTEFGTISVAGSTVTLHREFPTPGTTPGTFEFFGDDRFTLDGDTEFDFGSGEDEAALSHMELVRR